MNKAPHVPFELVQKYGEVVPHVDEVPRTVTEIYGRWTGFDTNRSLGRRRRNERRWLATYLEITSKRGVIHRGVQQDGQVKWVGFWRRSPETVAANDTESHQHTRAGRGSKGQRSDGRSVGK